MKASELIEVLKKEIEIGGDNEVVIHADIGLDKDEVQKIPVHNFISVNTGGTCTINSIVLGFVTIITCK